MSRVSSVLCAAGLLLAAVYGSAQEWRPDIPRTWDDKEVAGFELPLAERSRTPRYPTAEEYYKLQPREIYKTYPVYAPGREPAGYREWLLQQEPEVIFDPRNLETQADWIRAGKVVFEAGIQYLPAAKVPTVDPWLPIAADGQLPFFRPGYRYVIRKKGVLETDSNSCANCHTRVMADGSFFAGAQGVKERPATEEQLRSLESVSPERVATFANRQFVLFGVPWIQSRDAFIKELTRERIIEIFRADRPGVMARQGTSLTQPVHVPSLIGIKDLKYLDATGLVRHRSVGDLMRYAAVNMGLDTLAHYGDFQPSSGTTPFSGEAGTRYSDEQLYALGLYIYSLVPPPNPNTPNDTTRRGEQVFRQQGCVSCHTPPLYTNNKLTPATGFQIPEDLRREDDILDVSVGTDPTLAMKTRRGTGFYKVPSLRGVWYRTSFGHTGQAETLEEWLDPARLRSDYVPKGHHLGPGPIQGHEFGLKLSPTDKAALIAFLKTL